MPNGTKISWFTTFLKQKHWNFVSVFKIYCTPRKWVRHVKIINTTELRSRGNTEYLSVYIKQNRFAYFHLITFYLSRTFVTNFKTLLLWVQFNEESGYKSYEEKCLKHMFYYFQIRISHMYLNDIVKLFIATQKLRNKFVINRTF